MGSNLALNILCAVANPLGAEGMLRIVRGALESRDLRKELPSLGLPLVIIQVLGNCLCSKYSLSAQKKKGVRRTPA